MFGSGAATKDSRYAVGHLSFEGDHRNSVNVLAPMLALDLGNTIARLVQVSGLLFVLASMLAVGLALTMPIIVGSHRVGRPRPSSISL